MTRFKQISIKRKLTSIIMLTTCIALVLACAAFVTLELLTFRRNLVSEMSTLAEIIGRNCDSALNFNQPETAEKILANLVSHSQIPAACIYRDGKVWARFPRRLNESISAPTSSSPCFWARTE